ncbi:MAG: glycine--tRNA ligase subunit beta [Thiohalocapsa sp.]
MAGELLLELLSEEIPARMQRRAITDLTRLLHEKLVAAEIPAATIRGYVTPRRLTVIADGIPERQPDRSEERRGPRKGAPPQALEGFLRATGLSSIAECEVRDTGRGEFYFAVIARPGQPAAEVLPMLVHAAISELPWPKSMRFPASDLRWVRPLNSVLCLFDGQVLALPLGAVPVGRATRGHRFLSAGPIEVDDAADYLDKLERAYVVIDQDRRRDRIAADLDRIAAAAQLQVKPDPGLLDEVAGLVEVPVVLMGAIDDASMALPPEVLATAMRTHQKYFSCLHPEGTAAPRFLFVANNLTPDDGKTIVAGNERVLKARLADARFFWDQDRKMRLEDRVAALKERVYYEKLGTMLDKAERIERLAGFLAEQLYASLTPAPAGIQGQATKPMTLDPRLRGDDEKKVSLSARRAAHLAKADLSTGMVGEFPELQGVMGRHYALNDGEDARIADAIADHYKPQGPNDSCPIAPVSIAVALADKIDSLAAFFSIGEKPTGSRDPFALRRAALGLIRIVLENRLRLPLRPAFAHAVAGVAPGAGDIVADLLDFIADRLKVHLREEGVRHDLIAAVFALAEDDLVRLLARVDALARFLGSEDGANLLVAYRRAANIVAIEERRDNRRYHGDLDRMLLRESPEQALLRDLDRVGEDVERAVGAEDFAAAMGHLAAMRQSVDAFFDKVTVNTDDRALRENRLKLLSRIRAVMNQVADFSQIEG